MQRERNLYGQQSDKVGDSIVKGMMFAFRTKLKAEKKITKTITQSATKVGMIVSAIRKKGVKCNDNDVRISRSGDNRFHIYLQQNKKFYDIGTAKLSKDNRWCVDRLLNLDSYK